MERSDNYVILHSRILQTPLEIFGIEYLETVYQSDDEYEQMAKRCLIFTAEEVAALTNQELFGLSDAIFDRMKGLAQKHNLRLPSEEKRVFKADLQNNLLARARTQVNAAYRLRPDIYRNTQLMVLGLQNDTELTIVRSLVRYIDDMNPGRPANAVEEAGILLAAEPLGLADCTALWGKIKETGLTIQEFELIKLLVQGKAGDSKLKLQLLTRLRRLIKTEK